jgi:hypothetical protein
MKLNLKDLPDHFMGNAMISLAIFLLLFPSSASVLCIAPGSHIAVEDINAACCSSSANGFQAENQPKNGFAAAGNCPNCIDIFLAANPRAAIPVSRDSVTPHSPADAYLRDYIQADTPSLPHQSATFSKTGAPIPINGFVPLRC